MVLNVGTETNVSVTHASARSRKSASLSYVTPDGKEQHDVVINKIDDSKEGGDWETDIQEAINMICFTMRVHSNLVFASLAMPMSCLMLYHLPRNRAP